jgi:hypothetical protein
MAGGERKAQTAAFVAEEQSRPGLLFVVTEQSRTGSTVASSICAERDSGEGWVPRAMAKAIASARWAVIETPSGIWRRPLASG